MDKPDTTFRVLRANAPNDRIEWTRFWQSWPDREVFAHPNYVKLFSTGSDQPLCACFDSDQGKVLYPFIFRDLGSEPYWTPALGRAADIVSPYGYGGAYFWGCRNRVELENAFWPVFNAWAEENAVVSEFVRFSLFDDTILRHPGTLRENRKNVVRDLRIDEDALWMDFRHKVRKNVKKARQSGVRVEVDLAGERLADFLRVYVNTMRRRVARDDYLFQDDFFRTLQTDLAGQIAFFHAFHQGRVVSTELVLISSRAVYSFLGGTDSEAFDLRPNDLLKYEIMLWAKSQGKDCFVLGGGYEPEDGIYQYKAAFAPTGSVPFMLGYRTFEEQVYSELLSARKVLATQNGVTWQPREGHFPAYRA